MPHKIRNEKESKNTIYIYDTIAKNDLWGDSVSAKDVILAIEEIDAGEIVVRINSPGGDVFEGDAIYNALRRRAASGDRIHVAIDGVAASAAAFVAMAGDTIEIAENAFLMIHESWTYAIGNKRDLRQAEDLLAKIDNMIANMMAKRSGQSLEDITAWMEAETWLDAKEAVAKGFADKIGTTLNTENVNDSIAKASAQWARMPAALSNRIASHNKKRTSEIAKSPTPRLAALNRRLCGK